MSLMIFPFALPMYLKKDLEHVEKQALSIICPGLAYREALKFLHIDSTLGYIANLCKKTFSSIANDPAHHFVVQHASIFRAVPL